MSPETHITDEALTAYLDGALSDAEAAHVRNAVTNDPALAARLDALDIPIAALRPALDAMLTDAPDFTLTAPMKPGLGPAASAIAASVILASGIGIGTFFSKPAPADWQSYVAAYQALYVEDTLNVVAQSPADAAVELTRVSATLGRDLSTVTDIPGLNYKRAQILGYQGKPLVQMAYLTKDGAPIALCIMTAPDTQTLANMRLEGLEAASWSDGRFAYLLIGGDDPEQIARAAEHLQAQL